MNFLKGIFDGETLKVLAASGTGTVAGFFASITLANIAALLGIIYVLIRIVKQLRDWDARDGED